MPLPFWIALGVLVLAVTVGAFHVFRRARAFMRTFRAFSGDMDRTMEKLNLSLARARAQFRRARLVDAQARSEPRAAQACRWPARAVLQAAVQDVLGSVRRLTAVYPRK